MKKESVPRIRTAMEYQKKAIMALMPEPMEEHFEVIGNEIKKMMAEMVGGMLVCGTGAGETKKEPGESKVKKVNVS